MTRNASYVPLILLCSSVAWAQEPAAEPATPAAPATEPAASPAPTPAEPVAPAPAAPVFPREELDRLRLDIKNELREEMRAEIERAAREAAQERRGTAEWEEESWIEEVRPKLNFIDFDGYFRTRVDLFQRAHLGTYDPDVGRGTSQMPPPLRYDSPDDKHDTLTTANMRLRLDPTINVSEDVRIRATVDVFDNLVLGSTPDSMPGYLTSTGSGATAVPSQSSPLSFLSSSQLSPQRGFNNAYTDSIKVKRLWGEVNTPFGQLRFGRMANHFGLGILANDGNCLECDYGDNADRIMFITRVLGHYIIPIWEWTSSGPWGRGGGPGNSAPALFGANEGGQGYDLDPRDDVRSWYVMVARQDSPQDIRDKLSMDGVVINYGFYGGYRLQYYDAAAYYMSPSPIQTTSSMSISRNAWAALGSVWGKFQWRKLRVEGELAGVYGHIGNVQMPGQSQTNQDIRGADGSVPHCYVFPKVDSFSKRGQKKIGDSGFGYNNVRFPPDPSQGYLDLGEGVCLRQLGFALDGSYTFLNDSLMIGGGMGYASGDDAPGFGVRWGSNGFGNPAKGDLDGRQYGGTMEDGSRDNTIENFRFNPDYRIDMLMFREVIGTVTDAVYVKPSVTYHILEGLGVKGEAVGALAQYASTTPGNSNLLGAEFNGHVFYKSEDGFYAAFTYAFMLPLSGFNHAKDGSVYTNVTPDHADTYKDAKFAQRFHGILGVQF